jgi:bifunctional non-homologous end joining protein LigD
VVDDSVDVDVAVGDRTLHLTSLDKVLYPATGFTKRDLIDYYARVADVLLPHIAGRPLTLGRWPSGVQARGFAQMECRGAPDWMRTRQLVLRTGEVRNYCVVDDLASLVWVANLGTIELHPYPGVGPDGELAAFAIFDLDPQGSARLLDAARAALAVRELLVQRGFEPVVKTSGGDGIHVFAPLAELVEFERVRETCAQIAAELAAPAIAVDCLQNHPRRSLAAPYSLRAAALPLVSTPVEWGEIERAVEAGDERALTFTAAEIPARIEAHGDLFAALASA